MIHKRGLGLSMSLKASHCSSPLASDSRDKPFFAICRLKNSFSWHIIDIHDLWLNKFIFHE